MLAVPAVFAVTTPATTWPRPLRVAWIQRLLPVVMAVPPVKVVFWATGRMDEPTVSDPTPLVEAAV